MDQDSAHMVVASKVPMLKPGEFTIWRMRIEQYILMVDYALWEVIENGLTVPKRQVMKGDAVICAFLASQPNSPQLAHEDLELIHPDDLKEIDLRWQMAMLTMRARRFLKKTRRKVTINQIETIGFDKFNVEWYNCHKRGHFTRECRALRNQDTKYKESTRRSVHMETPASIDLVSYDDLGRYNWSDQAKEGPNYALMAFTSLSSDSKIVNNYKKGLGYESYNAVPPPYTKKCMPLKPDLSYTGLDKFADKPVAENTNASKEETKEVRKNSDAPIIEEWMSNDKEENVAQPRIFKKTVRPNIVKKELSNLDNTHRPRGNQRN
nr:hypothetical protein [Tanacetum cinerariifolium]